MGIRERLSGNEAAAIAMKQINPDVVAAFPITPSTEIPQYFSTFVANGSVDTEFVAVESEHSAMSACIGASAAGARAMTATSSNGMSLMWEMLYIAASSRLPIIFPKDESIVTTINSLVEQNISLSKSDWDSFETSWDFKKHPLI